MLQYRNGPVLSILLSRSRHHAILWVGCLICEPGNNRVSFSERKHSMSGFAGHVAARRRATSMIQGLKAISTYSDERCPAKPIFGHLKACSVGWQLPRLEQTSLTLKAAAQHKGCLQAVKVYGKPLRESGSVQNKCCLDDEWSHTHLDTHTIEDRSAVLKVTLSANLGSIMRLRASTSILYAGRTVAVSTSTRSLSLSGRTALSALESRPLGNQERYRSLGLQGSLTLEWEKLSPARLAKCLRARDGPERTGICCLLSTPVRGSFFLLVRDSELAWTRETPRQFLSHEAPELWPIRFFSSW